MWPTHNGPQLLHFSSRFSFFQSQREQIPQTPPCFTSMKYQLKILINFWQACVSKRSWCLYPSQIWWSLFAGRTLLFYFWMYFWFGKSIILYKIICEFISIEVWTFELAVSVVFRDGGTEVIYVCQMKFWGWIVSNKMLFGCVPMSITLSLFFYIAVYHI